MFRVNTGAKCHFKAFDGASCNMTMCNALGANLDYYSPNFKPWIKKPRYSQIYWDWPTNIYILGYCTYD